MLYYIYGALQLLGGLVLFLVFGGLSMFLNSDAVADHANGDVAPAVVGTVMGVVGGLITLFVLVVAVLNILAARNIGKRKGRTLVMVAAGLDCFSFPFGTALGIFTFVELSKDDVKQLFTS
ncbi:MAG: hypothetical protein IPJ76_00560 [Flavobacteriales bacterium]|nr:MAG: hypothetical protein IPJ76_00560 [Flavobacteriales bacterium]